MTTNERLQATLTGWLEASVPGRMPDRVLESVFEQTRRSRQQRRWQTVLGSRSFLWPGAALAGTAVLVLTGVLAVSLLTRVGSAGPGQPSPTATSDGSLPAGPLRLWEGQGGGAGIDVTIPASGWFKPDDGFVLKNANPVQPDAAGLLVYAETSDVAKGQGDIYVYGDACHWSTTKPSRPVTTVAAAVAAFQDQAGHDASTPVDVSIGGRAGKSLTLRDPTDLQVAQCDRGEVRTLIEGDRARAGQAAGIVEELWIVDLGGRTGLVIFDLVYDDLIAPSVVEEMRSMVQGATFE
jgi:hypothetical protein